MRVPPLAAVEDSGQYSARETLVSLLEVTVCLHVKCNTTHDPHEHPYIHRHSGMLFCRRMFQQSGGWHSAGSHYASHREPRRLWWTTLARQDEPGARARLSAHL